MQPLFIRYHYPLAEQIKAEAGAKKSTKAAKEQARIAAILRSDSRIGVMVQNGKPLYYAFLRFTERCDPRIENVVAALEAHDSIYGAPKKGGAA